MITTTLIPPQISMHFDRNLLLNPIPTYSAENLLKIAEFLHRKLNSTKFNSHIRTKNKLYIKYLEFMELYGRAKIEEGKSKTKTILKTKWLGYRPELANRNDQRLFERLSDREKTSKRNRRSNEI